MKAPHPFHIHVPQDPVDLWAKLRALAARNHRKLKDEALLALVAHLKQNGMLSDKEMAKMESVRD